MINKNLQLIKQFRERTTLNDSTGLQKRRMKFLTWLLIRNYDLKVLEMYEGQDDVIKSKLQLPQYLHEIKFCNTRTQIKSEICAEIDKLDFEKAVGLICDICLGLIKKKFHFAVFFAAGQRSPHIKIYDFDELEDLEPHQREKARGQFWRSIIPFRIHILDQSVWSDDHYLPLEFAPHWKYGTPFNLLFEYVPEEEKQELKLYFDGGVVFDDDRKQGIIASSFVLKKGNKIISQDCVIGRGTVPIAEYNGLILGLLELQQQQLEGIEIFGDSELIINQMTGKYRVDHENLKPLHKKANSLNKNHKFTWIPREQNLEADNLCAEKLKRVRRLENAEIKC